LRISDVLIQIQNEVPEWVQNPARKVDLLLTGNSCGHNES